MNMTQTIEAARNVLRFRHMAVKTEKSYVYWIHAFALWCKAHPNGGHQDKVRGFLTHLARDKDVSASTQIYTHVAANGAAGVTSPLETIRSRVAA